MTGRGAAAAPPAPGTGPRAIAAWAAGARAALVLAALSFLAAAAWFPLRNPDIWFHLAAGRWMLQHRGVIRADPFSYTAAGVPWIAHEWGFEVAAAALHRWGGDDALVLAKVVIVLAMGALSLAACRAAGAGTLTWAPLLAVWTLTSAVYLYARPQVVTYALLALLMAVLLRWQRRGGRAPWVLPPIFLLWANLHAGFLAGLGVLAAFLAGGALRSRWPRGGGAERAAGAAATRQLALVSALSLAATLVNPFGWRLYLLPGQITGSAYLRSAVEEWLPSWDRRLIVDWDTRLFWAGLGLALASFLLPRRWPDPAHLVLVVAWGALAAHANRHIPVFGVVVMPIVARNLAEGARRRRAAPRPGLRAAACAGLAALLAGGTAWSATHAFPITHRPVFAGGVDRDRVPVDAVDWMDAHAVDGRAFNAYVFGGYLCWRQWPRTTVGMDGRNEVYGEALVREHYDALADPGVFQRFDARYRPELVLLDARRRDLDQPLFEHLLSSEEWSLVYSDRVANLFVRRIPRFEKVAAEGW